jgi:hypothetical protein
VIIFNPCLEDREKERNSARSKKGLEENGRKNK